MFIRKVVSYDDSWDYLKNKSGDTVHVLNSVFSKITKDSIAGVSSQRSNAPPSPSERVLNIKKMIMNGLASAGWSEIRYLDSNGFNYGAGVRSKDNVTIHFNTSENQAMAWLYTYTPALKLSKMAGVPVAIFLDEDVFDKFELGNSGLSKNLFDDMYRKLYDAAPLQYQFPFLMMLLGEEETIIDVIELTSIHRPIKENIIVNREIEIPPQYTQSAISILSLFDEVLRSHCPESKAKVRIEQDGLKIRLSITSENGTTNTIERLLRTYEGVVRGDISPEVLFRSTAEKLRFECELKIARMRLDMLRELSYSGSSFEGLCNVIGGMGAVSNINVEVKPVISVNLTNSIAINNHISDLAGVVALLAKNAEDYPFMKQQLSDLCDEVGRLKAESGEESIRNSTALSKLKSFLDGVGSAGSMVNEFLKKTNDGIDLLQKLANKYNQVASWCGAPQVPSFLLGKSG